MTLEEYINYLVFSLLSDFYNKAKKIEANINIFFINKLQISKNANNLYLSFNRLNQNILNTDTLGFLDIHSINLNYQIYLTTKFEWVIKLNNEKLIKLEKSLIDYIFYKVFNVL
ncbi:MAG: hypothetical protein ACP5RD_02075 [bacterium]|jgi:hypothetical protein